MSVAPVTKSVDVAIANASLVELAAIANAEAGLANEALGHTVSHALRAGEALNQAKELVGRGNWVAWVDENLDFSFSTADLYRRLARYRDMIVEQGFKSLDDVKRYLIELGRVDREQADAYRIVRAKEMQNLRKKGMAIAEIAEVYGISTATVSTYTSPKRRAAKVRQKRLWAAAQKIAKQKRRDETVRNATGLIAKAYSQTRILAETLENAATSDEDAEVRGVLRAALVKLYHVEDEIVRAVRVPSSSAKVS